MLGDDTKEEDTVKRQKIGSVSSSFTSSSQMLDSPTLMYLFSVINNIFVLLGGGQNTRMLQCGK